MKVVCQYADRLQSDLFTKHSHQLSFSRERMVLRALQAQQWNARSGATTQL
jgi:hypothetical protein